MIIYVDNEWPESLPLPEIDFDGQPINASVVTPSDSHKSIRRSRFDKTYITLGVSWVFTVAQMDTFKTFVQDDLGNGTASFKIELRYPRNSDLNWWQVRIAEDYEVAYLMGLWRVSAILELITETIIEEEI